MADEQTFVNTQVPVELDAKLRQIAAAMRQSRSEVVRQALEEFVTRFNYASLEVTAQYVRRIEELEAAQAVPNPHVSPED